MLYRDIHFIILHCSDSHFGDAALIDRWHQARGFQCIGYHYVVLNGYRTLSAYQTQKPDAPLGAIEIGRAETEIGAHCQGFNTHSIGVCLIGKGEYPKAQLDAARILIVDQLLPRYPQASLYGHYEFQPYKRCPLLDMDTLRKEWGVAFKAR
ncbi:MAG: N-acetylmuramoyl-L-alanine amidase [bacterium]|nr:N-acetylmuramoyl-L-alanine amidase [bacterium]